MSITIFNSTTKYSTGTAQTALNDIAAAYDGWKSVTYTTVGDTTSNVSMINVTDDIKIVVASTALQVTHTRGASALLGTSANYTNYRIVTTDKGVLFHGLTNSTIAIAVGKINNSTEIGVVAAGMGTSGKITPFTGDMAATAATLNVSAMITGATNQLIQALSWSCTDTFDDIKIPICCESSVTNTRAEVAGTKYYIASALAIKYS